MHRYFHGRYLALLFVLMTPWYTYADCEQHVVYSSVGAPVDHELCKQSFLVGYDKDRKVPDWVIYRLTSASVAVYHDRDGQRFKPDDDIPLSDSATLKSYAGSGFDRGHLAPAAAIDVTKETLAESFELTNIAPQLPGLNRAGWKKAEALMREMAKAHNTVYVISGTYGGFFKLPEAFEKTKANKKGRIQMHDVENVLALDGEVVIPAMFYKAFFIPSLHQAGAFVMPHVNISQNDIMEHYYTIEDLESMLGIDVFGNLKPQHYKLP